MRVFTVSDIHVDYPQNAKWVESLSNSDYIDDILILPGDISDVVQRLRSALEFLSAKFKCVFFVPGNHDIWVKSGDLKNSIEKFHDVLSLAESLGVQTREQTINNIRFVPLFSWYDFSFGQPSDYIKKAWMDFSRCIWPESLSDAASITQYFLDKNHSSLRSSSDTLVHHDRAREGITTVTFSHFLPRIDIMPAAIPLKKRDIYPVLGSSALDKQVRQLNSDIHIYGHSHVNRCVEKEGIFYINNAFAYPSEEYIARKRLLNVFEEVELNHR